MVTQGLPQNGILIAGAGVIGLTLALELHARGAKVVVLERDTALGQASTAAAGMLAAEDPHNPAELALLARFSTKIYPKFLAWLEELSGIGVPFQTEVTRQYLADGSAARLEEHSIDPRQLAAALRGALGTTSIELHEHTGDLELADDEDGVYVRDAHGVEYSGAQLVHANGAWFRGQDIVTPRKGQMLRVQLAGLNEVHRSEQVYIVPRTVGPQAGTALIGATVEDAGFDTTTDAPHLAHLRSLAAQLVPEVAKATEVEAWAGLRPATPDGLPVLGAIPFSPREFVATGHFRNGILLAPATAQVMADLLEGKSPTVDLSAFAPERFGV